MNMFSKNLLREGTEIALSQGQKMLGRIAKHAESGEALDLQDVYYAFTIDVFTSLAFGAPIIGV